MIAVGQTFGNYRVVSKLGTGGMGMVYLAEHPLIGKRVALKVIHSELSNNREVVQRFFQEARAVNQIGHEHVVEIHDFGVTADNHHFYIMELLEGITLSTVLAHEKRIELARALHIGEQIASALDAVHGAGIIHRDLKPDNVMLIERRGDRDYVKVLDFGLAKVLAAGGSGFKTAAGVLLGTPQYMSPEACESKRDLDHRTDIYALGVILFQMLTGVLPFDGESMGATLIKQVTTLPPALRAINPGLPPSVEQVVLRCLVKSPSGRFASMADLAAALRDPEGYLRSSPPIAPARSVAPGEAGADAKVVMAHAAAVIAAKPTDKTLVADLAAGTVALNPNTMQIGTPIGHTSTPPRRMWPIAVAVGGLVGLIGGAFAVVASRDREGGAAGSRPPAGSAVAAVEPGPVIADVMSVTPIAIDAVAVAIDGSSKPAVAQLQIDSTPPGARIYCGQRYLGTTPSVVEWPIDGVPLELTLRLAGYRSSTKQLTVTGDTTVAIQLARLPRPNNVVSQPPRGSGSSSNGLKRPGE